jgi:hypothetical protein
MPAFSYVHTGNAFESSDGSTLHVDLGVYPNANILNDLKLSSLREGPEEGREVTCCEYMRLDIPLGAAQTHLKVSRKCFWRLPSLRLYLNPGCCTDPPKGKLGKYVQTSLGCCTDPYVSKPLIAAQAFSVPEPLDAIQVIQPMTFGCYPGLFKPSILGW